MSENGASYSVGYGRPPREHCFPKGRSGNPRGRPKGAKSMANHCEDVLAEMTTVTEGTRRRRVPKGKAIVLATALRAMKGDDKAIESLLKMQRQGNEPAAAPQPEQLTGVLLLEPPIEDNDEWERMYGAIASGNATDADRQALYGHDMPRLPNES
jgi:Family of unknown function (DUF5681)